MSDCKVKHIITEYRPLSEGYEEFFIIEDKYVLGSGILIDPDGNVVWNHPWEHNYQLALYIKELDILITDRVTMPGPFTLTLGLCCIDMKTGKYLWKHWYQNGIEEKRALNCSENPDINLVKSIKGIDSKAEYILADGFKIRISDGSYSYIGDYCDLQLDYPASLAKSIDHYCYRYTSKERSINFGVSDITIKSKVIEENGYLFNKCDCIIYKGGFLYFFGIPGEKNPRGTIIFKFCEEQQRIVKQTEFPFRTSYLGAYNFLNKGVMLYGVSKDSGRFTFSMWFIDYKDL
jgi:hypothetical protein